MFNRSSKVATISHRCSWVLLFLMNQTSDRWRYDFIMFFTRCVLLEHFFLKNVVCQDAPSVYMTFTTRLLKTTIRRSNPFVPPFVHSLFQKTNGPRSEEGYRVIRIRRVRETVEDEEGKGGTTGCRRKHAGLVSGSTAKSCYTFWFRIDAIPTSERSMSNTDALADIGSSATET